MNAREQAREAATAAPLNWRYAVNGDVSHGVMMRYAGADAAGDVWEPLLRDLVEASSQGSDNDAGRYLSCDYCDGISEVDSKTPPVIRHKDDCVWLRAKEALDG